MSHDAVAWVRNRRKTGEPMSPLGEKVAQFLGLWMKGIYHIDSRAIDRVDWTAKQWIEIRIRNRPLATYDFDDLTRLVVLSHDLCLRVEIEALAPRLMQLTFTARPRGKEICTSMPTMEEHLAMLAKMREEPK